MNFFFENLSLLPETRQVMEHFKLVFGSGNSDLAKIRPLKIWTSWISPWVPPYGILPHLVIQIFLPTLSNLEKNEASKTYFQNTSLTSRIWICTLQYGSNLNSYQILKYRKKKISLNL